MQKRREYTHIRRAMYFVGLMIEGATLVFISAVPIYKDVPAKCFLRIFYSWCKPLLGTGKLLAIDSSTIP